MQHARKRLIVGNWKMHGSRAFASDLASELANKITNYGNVEFEMVLCPPAPFLGVVGDIIANTAIVLGGQDCHWEDNGAHTGDVSPQMLLDFDCKYVITGHSERRAEYGEDNALVRAKTAAAHAGGLIPILCIGENLVDREKGLAVEVVVRQLKESLPEGSSGLNTVVAYEPVWAIGTGKTPTRDDIAEVHSAIRAGASDMFLDHDELCILYGGSVKPDNAQDIIAICNVDGVLVGGASLKADHFWQISLAVSEVG